MQDHGGSLRHAAHQIPAVRPGLVHQLLTIERLGVVQGLLGRAAEHPVCLPLQGGEAECHGQSASLSAPLKIAAGPGCDTQGRRDTLCKILFSVIIHFSK